MVGFLISRHDLGDYGRGADRTRQAPTTSSDGAEYEVLLIHFPDLPVADVTWSMSWARPVCAQHNLL